MSPFTKNFFAKIKLLVERYNMTSSLITKKRIAKAFKDLLKVDTFDKISIVDIMETAGIRRQTFYNHFLDKYELLDWIFDNELTEYITHNLDFISGKNLLQELFLYFKQERSFYINLFDIKSQNHFYEHLKKYCRLIVLKVLEEYGQNLTDSVDFTNFLIDYHSNALAEFIKDYVNKKRNTTNPDYLIMTITGINIK